METTMIQQDPLVLVQEETSNTTSFRRLYLAPPLRAPELAASTSMTSQKELYWDRSHYDSHQAQIAALCTSSTLYIGNLSFSTKARHLRAHLETCLGVGSVANVHMGLDRMLRTPCGFAFAELTDRRLALSAVATVSGTKLCGSVIRVELDAGFCKGREFGRGARGGQVRHDHKPPVDRKRGRTYEPTTTATTTSTTAVPTNPTTTYEATAPTDLGSGLETIPEGNNEERTPPTKRQRTE